MTAQILPQLAGVVGALGAACYLLGPKIVARCADAWFSRKEESARRVINISRGVKET